MYSSWTCVVMNGLYEAVCMVCGRLGCILGHVWHGMFSCCPCTSWTSRIAAVSSTWGRGVGMHCCTSDIVWLRSVWFSSHVLRFCIQLIRILKVCVNSFMYSVVFSLPEHRGKSQTDEGHHVGNRYHPNS